MDQKDSFGDATPPHEPFDPSSTHSTPSPHSSLQIANDIDGVSDPDYGLDMTSSEYEHQGGYEEGVTSGASSPDYDYLALDEQPGEEESLPASSPDYDYLAADIDEISEAQMNQQPDPHKPLEAPAENEYGYVIHDGEEYILGTLMVRVLQARNVKLDHRVESGGLSSLLSNHRRARHKKYTQSPLSGGALTPSSQATLYSKLTFNSQQQYTDNAVTGMNGDYYWSRGDQSYFDVICPGYARVVGKKKAEKKLDDEEKKMEEDDDAACCKSSKVKEEAQKPQREKTDASVPPLLNLSVFSKKGGKSGKQGMSPLTKKKGSEFNEYDGESQYVGEVSINITRVLTGKTAYFDEWCTLHNDSSMGLEDLEDTAGRVRVVIEYEPADSPPRSGDVCIIANVYPAMEKELYPIPLYSIRTNRPVFHRSGSITHLSLDKTTSASSTTLSSSGSSSLSSKSTTTSQLVRQPKQFHVEECVGDHVVLSYKTPENWNVTFEIHRYNLLVTHRYCGTVEKVREGLLDFCDNISQSPMAGVLIKTTETIPDEGLVYVGAGAVGAAGTVLGRWMEVGLEGAINDVVDAANLDGRYSHLSDEEDEANGEETQQQNSEEQSSPLKSTVAQKDLEEPPEEKKALPGMPDCPITGQPMIDPVVAADGHTYERHAIARWFQTSNRSPLTGAVMSHANLVPNYLLLSSLGGDAKKS